MKAGLFICDHVQTEYLSQFGDYTAMFSQLFPNFEWVLYDVRKGHFPENLEECDLYMATGSKHSVYEDLDWIKQLKNVIVQLHQLQKYFIGVCFGHQLIAEALGGKVSKSAHGWCVGVHKFDIISNESWMKPYQSTLNLLMMCQDQILKLPKDATVHAKSAHCPNAIITVGDKILGVQAHPEFSKAYNQLLMQNRIERIGAAKAEAGIQSLKKEINADILQSWIFNFIRQS